MKRIIKSSSTSKLKKSTSKQSLTTKMQKSDLKQHLRSETTKTVDKKGLGINKLFSQIVHIFNVTLIIATFVLMLIALFKPEWFEIFIEWMRGIVYWLGYWNYFIVFITAFLESFPLIGMSVPWQNIMLIVWWFFWETHLVEIIFIAIFWAILWNFIWYLLWVHYGEWFFKKYGDWIGIGMTELKYMKWWIKTHGWWMMVVGKFHNMLRAFVPFIAWSMGMKNKVFWISNIIWAILRAIIIILLWVLFVSYYQKILEYAPSVLILIMCLLILYIYFFKKEEFKIYWKEKNEELDKKLTGKIDD